MIRIDIIGSCVSRDIFRFDYQKKLEVAAYVARNPIFSLMSPKPTTREIPIEDFSDILNDWERRCVYINFNKTAFALSESKRANYIIIDFIDERFDLLEFKLPNDEYSYVGQSEVMEKYLNHYSWLTEKESVYQKRSFTDFTLKEVAEKTNAYIDYLLQLYAEENIIVNEAYYVGKYLDINNNIQAIPDELLSRYTLDPKKTNPRLEFQYDLVKKRLSKAMFLSWQTADEIVASERHAWALAPMHYYDKWYMDRIEQLYKTIRR